MIIRSQLHRRALVIFFVCAAAGCVVGLLGMLGVLGGWAETVGSISIIVGVVVEYGPLACREWQRQRRDGQDQIG
jgi:hypothetical protein